MTKGLRFTFMVLALLLGMMADAPRAAVAGGAVRSTAHLIMPVETITRPVFDRLPGDRVYTSGEMFVACYRSNEPLEADYVTGCWYFEAQRMMYPDGRQEVWGTSSHQDLPAFPNGEGAWIADFTGEWVRGFPVMILSMTITAHGCGALEGWSLAMTVSNVPGESFRHAGGTWWMR